MSELLDLWKYEKEAREQGYCRIAGTDEAGRGPLAGPVCAAAVILPFGVEIPGLTDSKKLTEKKREALFPIIQEKALAYAIEFAWVEEIEEYNILHASQNAMRRAVETLNPAADFVLVDGNRSDGFPVPDRTIVKGDALSLSIAAASVLAKVSRDRLMVEYAKAYPGYGFEVHKGYPTKAHYEALRALGPCEIHRPSFLRKKH
ncbi:MAG: ribonuclease HII [Clostridia bacterium]|nr:ribonuclease HII [Clostridia bacterium]